MPDGVCGRVCRAVRWGRVAPPSGWVGLVYWVGMGWEYLCEACVLGELCLWVFLLLLSVFSSILLRLLHGLDRGKEASSGCLREKQLVT